MMPAMPDASVAPILVVGRSKIVTLVRAYLGRERWPVVTAGDGRAALRAIDEHPQPRLDLMLPNRRDASHPARPAGWRRADHRALGAAPRATHLG
jgi:CheY-like chemotaxis protein